MTLPKELEVMVLSFYVGGINYNGKTDIGESPHKSCRIETVIINIYGTPSHWSTSIRSMISCTGDLQPTFYHSVAPRATDVIEHDISSSMNVVSD